MSNKILPYHTIQLNNNYIDHYVKDMIIQSQNVIFCGKSIYSVANLAALSFRLREFFYLVVFSFFKKTTYCCRARRLSVRPSVEIISFRSNSLSNRPIELKIGLNVREGVVHVRKT